MNTRSDGPGAGLDYYWCAAPSEEMPPLMMSAWNRYLDHLQSTGRLQRWQRSHALYFGHDAEGTGMSSHSVQYGGEQGETVLVRANHYRALMEHIHVLITGTRPTLIARGMNASSASQTAARLAEGVFEYYLGERHLEQAMQSADRYALRYGEGWVYPTWDPDAGEAYDVERVMDESRGEPVERVVYQGDIVARALMPIDVIRDPSHDLGAGPEPWLMAHTRRLRWDLVAQYPDAADFIRAAPSHPQVVADVFTSEDRRSTDYVSTLELYAGRTPAMPQGRYVMVVGDGVLFDGPLPYDIIPLLPMRPDIETRTAFGYSTCWDLMGLQDVLDSIISAVVSNHDVGALRNVWTPLGSGLSVEDLRGGLKHWESKERPELIDLMPNMGESHKLAEMVLDYMSTISGINSVAQGQPDPNIKSGSMAALVHSMAVQYNSGLQQQYAALYESLGTHFLDCARRYMSTPRLVALTGPRGSAWVRDFRGQDVAGIRRIAVDAGNALLRHTAGRQEVANKLLEVQMIATPDQYLQMISTGRFEPVLDRPDTKLRGIQSENDRLIRGQTARVMITDHHADHIDAHLALLDEPEVREDEEVAAMVLDHIQLHIELWQQTTVNNPGMLGLIGLPPYPMGGGGPPEGEGAAPPGGGGPPMEGGVTAAPPETGALDDQPGIRMPSMPTVPGQAGPYDPAGGAP